jgi:hypothetical protein
MTATSTGDFFGDQDAPAGRAPGTPSAGVILQEGAQE